MPLSVLIIGFIILFLGISYTIYRIDQRRSKKPINEFEFFKNLLNQYTCSFQFGSPVSNSNIPIDAQYYVETNLMIYLFDDNKIMFAMYVKETKKTYLYTLNNLLRNLKDFETCGKF